MEEAKQTVLRWDEEPEGLSNEKFFKPEFGRLYRITISGAKKLSKIWKEGEKAKMVVELKISAIDGQGCDKIWTTGSFKAINKVKELALKNALNGAIFIVKKIEEHGKTTYLFEIDKEGVQSPPSKLDDGTAEF